MAEQNAPRQSCSGQLTSHTILYPIIGVKYQEPVRHVTCKLMGGGSWQPVLSQTQYLCMLET